MSSKTFTELGIERMKPPGKDQSRVEIWDKLLPGFGLRISAAGTKTFVLMYRFEGKLRRMTIGRYDSETFRLDKGAHRGASGIGAGRGRGMTRPRAMRHRRRRPARFPMRWRSISPGRSNRTDVTGDAVERALKLDLETRLGTRPRQVDH